MPFLELNGVRHYYRLEGADDRPVLILSHCLGLDHGLWDVQSTDFQPYVQVLRYDTRGHGASAAPGGDYTVAQLGADALALADALGIRQFALCGLSLGGMIGQWLALHHPERLTHLVLADTSARLTEPALMETRRRTALSGGMAAVVDAALPRFFSPSFFAARGPAVQWARRTLLATDPVGYAGCCAAIRDLDYAAAVRSIRVPTLVINGEEDVSMPPAQHGDLLARSIEGAQSVTLPAGHASNLERPRSFSAAVLQFLLPPPHSSHEAGAAVRRAVLGSAHVDRSAAAATDFTRDFQELITQMAWGAVWARPGLDRRTRRLLVLTTTAALARWEEYRLHVRTGLAGELEASELKEVLLQLAVYAGVPAANTAFNIAEEELSRRTTQEP